MTAYTLGNTTLPKDAGGQQFLAVVQENSSVNDFALIRGVGASETANSSKVTAGITVGTHNHTSPIDALHNLVAVGGVYIEDAGASPAVSAVATGQAQMAVMSNWGELFTTGAPKTASHVSTSTNLIKNGSGIVFGFSAGWTNGNAGDPIRLEDGANNHKISIVTGGSSGFESFVIPAGGIAFDTNIICKKPLSGGGDASMIITYR